MVLPAGGAAVGSTGVGPDASVDSRIARFLTAAEPCALREAFGLSWVEIGSGRMLQSLPSLPSTVTIDGSPSLAALAVLVDSTLGATGAVAGGHRFAVTLGLRIELTRPLEPNDCAIVAASDVLHADRSGSLVSAVLRTLGGVTLGLASHRALGVDAHDATPRAGDGVPRANASEPGTAGHPIDRLLGADTIECADGRSRVCVRARPELANGAGRLHGGVVAGIAQRAAYFAVASTIDAGGVGALILDVDFLRPVNPGSRIEAKGIVRTRTRRYAWAESEVWLPDGKVAARARVLAALAGRS